MSTEEKTDDKIFENPLLFFFILSVFLIAGITLALTANGTSDEGDSVMHYQYAKFAWKHHELFFDHWAKPLYVLLASPFTQFGYKWFKVFQICFSGLAMFLTWRIAVLLQIKRNTLVALFLLMSPALLKYSLSGLTEPLFTVILMSSIYFYLKNKTKLSILIVSFLPFIRTEGLIICGVFGLLLLLEKKYWILPLLAVGHIVYSIAGYWVHGTVLWVFTKIPYVMLASNYGKGTWSHFFVNMPAITGIPICILLVAGIVALPSSFKKIADSEVFRREALLIYGIFIAFFLSHVFFWALGIFHSFGLLRVMAGVLPLMAVIEIRGINLITDFVKSNPSRLIIIITFCVWICIFPFTKNDSAWHYKRDFCLLTGEQLLVDVGDYIHANYPDYKNGNYYFDANFTAVAVDIDYFDTAVCRRTWESWEHPPHKSFYIWDDWFTRFDNNRPLSEPMNDSRFQMVKEFIAIEPDGKERKTVLFKSKDF